MNVRGSKANKKYIAFFSLFTLIPSVLIAIFSLFLFSFALEKYFDNKITTAVNNSYELAKNYVDEKRNKIESDIVLIGFDLNKNISTLILGLAGSGKTVILMMLINYLLVELMNLMKKNRFPCLKTNKPCFFNRETKPILSPFRSCLPWSAEGCEKYMN